MSLPLKGVVHATGGGVYEVVTPDGDTVEASLRGRLKTEARTGHQVVIGDRVELAHREGAYTIEVVEERRTELVRRGRRWRDAKVVAANLTDVFAVVAAREPRPSPELIDRLLVIGEAAGLVARLVVNKVDLPGAAEVAAELTGLYRGIGYEVFPLSAQTGEGVTELGARLCEGRSALIGPSGVGKSSILNAFDEGLRLRTGDLSSKTGTGRHTTVRAQLLRLECGGAVADTPGFGDVALWGVPAERLAECFPELAELAETCRFRGCAHVHEPDCGVRAALEEGAIPASRYASYLRLREEADTP